MSVYTPVTAEDLDAWLSRYAVGALVDLAPIAAGIENTNYFVTTENGRYVLTLYERLPAEELPFYLNLMAHLARAGSKCRRRRPTAPARCSRILNGKPAGLVERVDGARDRAAERRALRGGRRRARPAARRVADATARGSPTGAARRGGGRRRAPCVRSSRRRRTRCSQAELKFQTGFGKAQAAEGARSTATSSATTCCSTATRVVGIIDFGFAATDFLAYDLAITVNDWCDAGDGSLDDERTRAFVVGLRRRAPARRPTSASSGRRCCAPPRCASGCRGSTTCTCRAPASSRTRTTRRASSVSSRSASPRCRGCRNCDCRNEHSRPGNRHRIHAPRRAPRTCVAGRGLRDVQARAIAVARAARAVLRRDARPEQDSVRRADPACRC